MDHQQSGVRPIGLHHLTLHINSRILTVKHFYLLCAGAFVAGWVANNLTQGGTAFQMPASGTWFSSAQTTSTS
jgi:hypothetical protein